MVTKHAAHNFLNTKYFYFSTPILQSAVCMSFSKEDTIADDVLSRKVSILIGKNT